MKTKNNKYIFISLLIIILLGIMFIINSYNSNNFKLIKYSNKIEQYKASHENLDVVGWITVYGTNISFPVIYTTDNNIINNLEGNFSWQIEKSKNISKREIIFGHNILNLSSHPKINDDRLNRFEQLMSFIYYDFAKDNQFIQFTKNNKEYIYQIFSVELIRDYELLYKGPSINNNELEKYINKSIDSSFYKYDIDVSSDDDIITLITCTRFYGPTSTYKFKVDGKLVNKNSYLKNNNVTKNGRYKYILSLLKEEDEDEKI